MFITWLSETGLVNNILMDLNLVEKPIRFLTDPKKYWAIAVMERNRLEYDSLYYNYDRNQSGFI